MNPVSVDFVVGGYDMPPFYLEIPNYANNPNYTDYHVPNDLYSDNYYFILENYLFDRYANTSSVVNIEDINDYNLNNGLNDGYNPYMYTLPTGTVILSSIPLTPEEVEIVGNNPCNTHAQVNVERLNNIYCKGGEWGTALNLIDGARNSPNEHSINLNRFVVEGQVIGDGYSFLVEGTPYNVPLNVSDDQINTNEINNPVFVQTVAVIHTHPVRDVTLVNGQPQSAWDPKPVYFSSTTTYERTYAPPSAGDLYAFLQIAQDASAQSWSITPAFIIKASNGDDYALMLNNQQLADNFLNNYPSNLDDKGNFSEGSPLGEMFNEYYKYYRSNDRHEKHAYALASLLKEVCPGVSLYKKGSGDSSWRQLNTEETSVPAFFGLIQKKAYVSSDCN